MNEGDGAFYGPKIDLHMTDALGRSWQMGTIQLDAQMPQNFGLSYMGADNREHTPYVIHRALLGSLERFIGILTEHYAGAFPFWLAPVQVRVLPVGEDHLDAARTLMVAPRRRRLPRGRGRADRDDRQADPRRPSWRRSRSTIVYGDRESDESLAVRAARRRAARRSRYVDVVDEACYPVRPEKQERTRSSPPGPATARAGFNRVGRSTRKRAAACSGFSRCESETRRSKPNLVICL